MHHIDFTNLLILFWGACSVLKAFSKRKGGPGRS
jgi:hypothetical protein